jgi:3-oxoacyl-(acyl-carrier-protein) synthase
VLVTPYGLGSDALRAGLFAGRSAIGPIRRFDPSRFPCRIGGEIGTLPLAEHFERAGAAWMSTLAAHAILAGRMAIANAGLESGPRTGAAASSSERGSARWRSRDRTT